MGIAGGFLKNARVLATVDLLVRGQVVARPGEKGTVLGPYENDPETYILVKFRRCKIAVLPEKIQLESQASSAHERSPSVPSGSRERPEAPSEASPASRELKSDLQNDTSGREEEAIPSSQQGLGDSSPHPAERESAGSFLWRSVVEDSLPAGFAEGLRACGDESPWKRQKSDSLADTCEAQADKLHLTSDAPARKLSLRERLLSRMGPEIPIPPAAASPDEDNREDSQEAREHKQLGGLSFKWKLLFHAGSKPVKKGSSSATGPATSLKKAACKAGA